MNKAETEMNILDSERALRMMNDVYQPCSHKHGVCKDN